MSQTQGSQPVSQQSESSGLSGGLGRELDRELSGRGSDTTAKTFGEARQFSPATSIGANARDLLLGRLGASDQQRFLDGVGGEQIT